MKLMYCPQCRDVVLMWPEPRSCACGASSGRYVDNETVEQTDGTVSIALHNHDFAAALQVFAQAPAAWHPLFTFRAYLNPHCETDVTYAKRPA
ncbi:MAG TPA: hypothetical protein VGO62_03110 [Myxococcota bacterium]|jgi:hypothetical protein